MGTKRNVYTVTDQIKFILIVTPTTSLQKCQIKLFSNEYNNSNIILIRYRSDYTIPFTFTTPSLRPNDNSFVVSIARFQFNDIRRNVNH